MKIEKDYFIEHEGFTEVFSVERIDFVNDNAYFETEATYTTLKEALKDFKNQCKKHKDTLFRIEPYNVYWWQDGSLWKFDEELNLVILIFVSNSKNLKISISSLSSKTLFFFFFINLFNCFLSKP